MIRASLSALLSHWRRHPLQLAMLVIGLALATALWTGVQAINAEARAAYGRASEVLGGDRMDRLEATGAPLTVADFGRLRREGWPVSPVIQGRDPKTGLRVLGLDPLTLPMGAAPAGLPLPAEGDLLAFLAGKTALVAPDTLARTPDLAEAWPGVSLIPTADLPPGLILADIGLVARRLDRGDEISALLMPRDAPRPAAIPSGMTVSRGGGEAGLAQLTDSFHLNLTAFGFLAFVVGIFIVHSATGLAFADRRPVFRSLRALGLSARMLTGLVLAEMLVLALVAGSLGVGLGARVAAALLPDVAATLDGLYGAAVPGALQVRAGWVLAGFGMAVLGTGLAAGQGLWQVWRMPPLESVRPEAWALAGARSDRRLGLAGLGAVILSGFLLSFGQGLWTGFLGLGLLLLGAALVLPRLFGAVLAGLAARARPGLGQWFWADSRQQVPGLMLSLMALLLALAANVGVGTMVGSFRATFTGWLDQRMVAEMYLRAETPEEAKALQDWLTPRVSAVLPVTVVEADLLGRPGEIYGVIDQSSYRDHWPLLAAIPEVWEALHRGEGVLLNEQGARRSGVWLGDMLDLPGGTLPVIGVYSDYGNPQPQAILGIVSFQARFPATTPERFALRLPPEAVPGLAVELMRVFALDPEAITDQASIKAYSLQVFERTFAVTGALNVLTLAVAALAMLASLLTLAGQRLPGLAPVWAQGVTQGRLAWLEFARSVALALLTALCALPLGLALAWVLLAVINVEAFGWRLPMQVFTADILRLFLMALATGVLAAAWPAWQVYRRSPADLLRVFAHAR